jgi:hypothetical protein
MIYVVLVAGGIGSEYLMAWWASRVAERAGSTEPVWWILGLFFSWTAVTAAYSYAWARRRGRSGVVWACLGFLAGWIPVAAVIVLVTFGK